MKLFVFLIITCAFLMVESVPLKEHLGIEKREIEEMCEDTYNLDPKIMVEVTKEVDTPDDNEVYGNYFDCVLQVRGILNEDGKINEAGFINFITIVTGVSEIQAQKMLDSCKGDSADSRPKFATKLKNCIMRNVAEIKA